MMIEFCGSSNPNAEFELDGRVLARLAGLTSCPATLGTAVQLIARGQYPGTASLGSAARQSWNCRCLCLVAGRCSSPSLSASYKLLLQKYFIALCPMRERRILRALRVLAATRFVRRDATTPEARACFAHASLSPHFAVRLRHLM